MATVRSGSALSVTVTVAVPPSAAVYVAAPKLTVTCGSSSSLMLTVVSAVAPAVTPVGSAPKASFTLSPSSSSVSCVAVKTTVLDVSPELKVTLVALRLKSAEVAPPWPTPTTGIVTDFSGSALNTISIVVVAPSATTYEPLSLLTRTSMSSSRTITPTSGPRNRL